ncbi:hypothetical protein ABIB26_004422 [Arthrobacter sp. UYEF20]
MSKSRLHSPPVSRSPTGASATQNFKIMIAVFPRPV